MVRTDCDYIGKARQHALDSGLERPHAVSAHVADVIGSNGSLMRLAAIRRLYAARLASGSAADGRHEVDQGFWAANIKPV
jgi:hypothetical protein